MRKYLLSSTNTPESIRVEKNDENFQAPLKNEISNVNSLIFGHNCFRAMQEDIISAVLDASNSDVLHFIHFPLDQDIIH